MIAEIPCAAHAIAQGKKKPPEGGFVKVPEGEHRWNWLKQTYWVVSLPSL
jgi:hypothetical protein